MASVQKASVFDGVAVPGPYCTALSEADSAIEEGMGLAFMALRDLRMALSAPFDVVGLKKRSEEIGAASLALSAALDGMTNRVADEASTQPSADALLNLTEWCRNSALPGGLTKSLLDLAKALPRKSSSPSTRLAKIMQARDEISQRLEHARISFSISADAPPAVQSLALKIIAGQLDRVADSLDELMQASNEACLALSKIVEDQTTSLAQVLMLQASDQRSGDTNLTSLPDALTSFGVFLDSILEGCAEGDDAQRGTLASARQRMVGSLSDLIGPLHKRLHSASESTGRYAKALAGLQLVADDIRRIAEEVSSDPHDGRATIDAENETLQSLWGLYTMDAERDVHRRIVGEQPSSARR